MTLRDWLRAQAVVATLTVLMLSGLVMGLIEAEWLDRYGPLPEPAAALLRIGHLRAV